MPQILTNRAEDFIWAAGEMKARGYREVNLNLGCPSGTVVSKYKGAGFLARQEALNRFLDQIFQEVDLEISVKTRIGIAAPEEFPELMEIFNRYPIRELTVHPRLRTDFYKNTPDWESFGYAVKESRAPLCYKDVYKRQLLTLYCTCCIIISHMCDIIFFLYHYTISNPICKGKPRKECASMNSSERGQICFIYTIF